MDFLLDTNLSEIAQIVKVLKNSKSVGYNGLWAAYNNKSYDFGYCHPITIIFNKSLASGQFPDFLNLAKVSHIHKGDDRKQIINYRPISVLPFFKKYWKG